MYQNIDLGLGLFFMQSTIFSFNFLIFFHVLYHTKITKA